MKRSSMTWILAVAMTTALVATAAWTAAPGAGAKKAPAAPQAAEGAGGPCMGPCMMGMGMGMGMGMEPGMGMSMRMRGRMGACCCVAGPGGPALAKELNLTAEQKKKLEDIRFSQQRKAVSMRADVQVAEMDLRQLMRAERPDQRAIEAQIDKIADLRATLQKSRVATLLEMRSVLSPEQLKKWRELRTERPGLGGGPGMMGGRGMRAGHGMMRGQGMKPMPGAKPGPGGMKSSQ